MKNPENPENPTRRTQEPKNPLKEKNPIFFFEEPGSSGFFWEEPAPESGT